MMNCWFSCAPVPSMEEPTASETKEAGATTVDELVGVDDAKDQLPDVIDNTSSVLTECPSDEKRDDAGAEGEAKHEAEAEAAVEPKSEAEAEAETEADRSGGSAAPPAAASTSDAPSPAVPPVATRSESPFQCPTSPPSTAEGEPSDEGAARGADPSTAGEEAPAADVIQSKAGWVRNVKETMEALGISRPGAEDSADPIIKDAADGKDEIKGEDMAEDEPRDSPSPPGIEHRGSAATEPPSPDPAAADAAAGRCKEILADLAEENEPKEKPATGLASLVKKCSDKLDALSEATEKAVFPRCVRRCEGEEHFGEDGGVELQLSQDDGGVAAAAFDAVATVADVVVATTFDRADFARAEASGEDAGTEIDVITEVFPSAEGKDAQEKETDTAVIAEGQDAQEKEADCAAGGGSASASEKSGSEKGGVKGSAKAKRSIVPSMSWSKSSKSGKSKATSKNSVATSRASTRILKKLSPTSKGSLVSAVNAKMHKKPPPLPETKPTPVAEPEGQEGGKESAGKEETRGTAIDGALEAPPSPVESEFTASTSASTPANTPVRGNEAEAFAYYQVVLSGKPTDAMIRLSPGPKGNADVTFKDLRREIEEDHPEEFGKFKFTVDKGGMGVRKRQEKKWRVRDYGSMTEGGDGSYRNPYQVYIVEGK